MDWHKRIRDGLADAPAPPDVDVVEELAQHAAQAYDNAIARGSSPAEAELGVQDLLARWRANSAQLRRRAKQPAAPVPPPERSPALAGLWHDLRYAVRLLARQPRFAALVVLTMALGIGATTSLFSVTYGVLLKPLPWPDADRLVVLKETRGGRAPRFGSFSNTAYLAWRDDARMIDEIAAWTPRTFTLSGRQTGAGAPERIRAASVTASLFRAIGARPVAGSLFTDADELSSVVVIAESLWRDRFGADNGLLGKSIQVDDQPFTVVGVLPDALAYPNRDTKAWLPFRVPPPQGNLLSMFEAIAKLHPGATMDQAWAEGTARGRFAAPTGMTTTAIFGGDGPVGVSGRSLPESLTADVRLPLTVLLAAVGLLLLIAVTNIAGLQIARAASRRRELVIRASIGASAGRLIRQLLIESLVLGAIGGAAGLGLAWTFLRSASTLLPADFPRVSDVALGGPVVLFAIVVSLVTCVAFGVLPALGLRRLTLTGALGDDGAASATQGRTTTARTRFVIVSGQFAVACVLLAGALLLGRSFLAMLHAERGLEPEAVVSARVAMPSPAYTATRRPQVVEQILERISHGPGVEAVAFTTELPLTQGGSTSAFTMPAREPGGETVTIQASPRIVSPGYFTVLGLRILDGRSLADSDTASSEPVVVVNDTFRRRHLGSNALGARLPMSLWGQNQSGEATVVGVTEDVRYVGAATPTLPELYFSYRQLSVGIRPSIAWFFVRPRSDAAGAGALIRDAVTATDKTLVTESIVTLEDRLLAGSLSRPRLYAVLIASFAVLAIIVTGVGLFAVLSYSVSQRTRELAVRAALGAGRLAIVRLVLAHAAATSFAGIVVGLAGSLWLGQFVRTLLFDISPIDATTYVAVPLALVAVAIVACVIPARRAAKLDPAKVLR